MNKVIIIGASGFGKLVADIVLNNGDEVVGFLDDNPEIAPVFFDRPVLGKSIDFERFADCKFIISIGNPKIREMMVNRMKSVEWYTAIHPKAIISPYHTKIGKGTVILPGAVIDPYASIGDFCLINCNAVVAHDCVIDDYVHISVGTNVAGTVHVGKRTWIGIGASVSNDVNICEDCMIGAGAVVVKDISESGTYVGVPAKRIK